MNKELISRHNSVVSPTDTVIHVGDFSMKASDSQIASLVGALHGYKVIIRGNHDPSPAKLYKFGFNLVLENMVITLPNYGRVFVRHFPTYPMGESTGQDTYKLLSQKGCLALIHGHIHNSPDPVQTDKKFFNVSCEMVDYTPISESTLVARIKEKQK